MPGPWWHDFFDEEYVRLFAVFTPPERSQREADALWSLLGLSAGSRLLDAPCGYGRLSVPLAERGARVVGVDYSEALLRQAESARGPLPPDRLRFLRHDLRQPLSESGFDAAINVFSSLGYGSEEDDLAILRTLAAAGRAGAGRDQPPRCCGQHARARQSTGAAPGRRDAAHRGTPFRRGGGAHRDLVVLVGAARIGPESRLAARLLYHRAGAPDGGG